MYVNVKIAKLLMNMMHSKPSYNNAKFFIQELFHHPAFKLLSDEEKSKLMIEWVNQACLRASQKPFEQYYPNFPFNDYFSSKTVLDLGCSIGGKTFYFAEKFHIKSIYGIDVDKESINSANLFLQHKNDLNSHYDFRSAYAENLPFDDNIFDAIISHDTIEHVRDVKETLKQCKRVTKKGGLIFLVFPSYYFPFGGAHIGAVTKTPFLEWFFSAGTLNMAYNEIVSDWDGSYNWYRHIRDEKYSNWEKVEGGIGINGTTYKEFNTLVNEVGFSKIEFVKIPLINVSFIANRYPIIKLISNIFRPLLRFEFFIDFLSHRLAYILTV
jgi:ubiquinone/menaquinone biosynthesis C-methylase UbiE